MISVTPLLYTDKVVVTTSSNGPDYHKGGLFHVMVDQPPAKATPEICSFSSGHNSGLGDTLRPSSVDNYGSPLLNHEASIPLLLAICQ